MHVFGNDVHDYWKTIERINFKLNVILINMITYVNIKFKNDRPTFFYKSILTIFFCQKSHIFSSNKNAYS